MTLKSVTESERKQAATLYDGKMVFQSGGNQPGTYIYSGSDWRFVG